MDCVALLDAPSLGRLAEQHDQWLRALAGNQAERIVDKMPDNYLYLGLLAAMFPQAVFVHCRRDLRDVAVSCWMTDFRSILWANDPEHIASRFRQYRRLMDHWRGVLPAPIHEFDYEETVSDLEGGRGVCWRRAAWSGSLPAWNFTVPAGRSARPAWPRYGNRFISNRSAAGGITKGSWRICLRPCRARTRIREGPMAKRKSTRKSSQRSVRNDSIRLSFESLERRLCLAVIKFPTDMGLAAAIATADSNADNDNIMTSRPAATR